MTVRRSSFGRVDSYYWPVDTPCHGCRVTFTSGMRFCYPEDVLTHNGASLAWCRDCADREGWVRA